jgi:lipopolysaccharide transport system ATP-binding protein
VTALRATRLTKTYPLDGSPWSRFRHALNPASQLRGIEALSDVSFTVDKGEAFGIIGSNGSGKSTLLQIVAGILRPSSGEIEVHGRLSALLELGSGFSPEFTGRQNVFLNASILGLTQEETAAKLETIEAFAGIGEFIDQPIRTYSSGMVLRLAFAVVAHVDPEVLIVDEALAVGDIAFRQRCMRRIHDLRAQGVTILFVSHDTGDVKALCKHCLWLDKGRTRMLGPADEVIGKYLSNAIQKDTEKSRADRGVHTAQPHAQITDLYAGKHRFGNARAQINSIELNLAEWEAGASAVITVKWKALAQIDEPIVGYHVRNEKGEIVFGTNTGRENYPVPALSPGEDDAVEFHLTLPDLAPGNYFVSAAVSEGTIESFDVCDYIEDAVAISTPSHMKPQQGYLRLKCRGITLHTHPGHAKPPAETANPEASSR